MALCVEPSPDTIVALLGILVKQERIGAIAAALLLWLTFGELLALLGELLNNGPFFIFAPLALLVAMPWLIEAKALLASGDIAGAQASLRFHEKFGENLSSLFGMTAGISTKLLQ